MKTNNKTQTNNTTTMVGSNTNQTNNKTTMKPIKIEWTVDHWLAILPDGTKKFDHRLPVLITSITGGDIKIAEKIEIIF